MTDIVLQQYPLSPSASATRVPASDPDPIVGDRVELQLLTTLKCNLKCTYCSLGVGDVLGSQNHVEYTVDELAAFVDRHLQGKEVYVTFYGGEPTESRDARSHAPFPLFRFQLQTNGTARRSSAWALGRLSISWSPSTVRQPPTVIAVANLPSGDEKPGHVRERIGSTVPPASPGAAPTLPLRNSTNWPAPTRPSTTSTGSSSPTRCTPATRSQALGRVAALDRKFFAHRCDLSLIPLMGIVRNRVLPTRGLALRRS
jgi:hypothetical protein